MMYKKKQKKQPSVLIPGIESHRNQFSHIKPGSVETNLNSE